MSNYAPAFQKSIDRLIAHPPAVLADRASCRFDEQTGRFAIVSLGHEIAISYPDARVCFRDTGRELALDWALIVLNHLSSARAQTPAGDWISFGHLPQGRDFGANIRRTVLEPLALFCAQCDETALRRSFAALGFVAAPIKADLAMSGYFVPRVPIAFQFWQGEEDIPPACQILLDRTISDQMHVEDIAVLCSLLKRLVVQQYARDTMTETANPASQWDNSPPG